jgi:hypothetical protein
MHGVHEVVHGVQKVVHGVHDVVHGVHVAVHGVHGVHDVHKAVHGNDLPILTGLSTSDLTYSKMIHDSPAGGWLLISHTHPGSAPVSPIFQS